MHPKFQDFCEGMTFANLREMAKAAGGVMERAWHRLKYVPPPARTDQVARDLAFVEHHSVAPNPGYALSAGVGPSAAALAQGHPPAPTTQSAGIGPQPWWPLHPAAVQASHCKTQQLTTAPAPFPPVPRQLPPRTFQQFQAPTVVAPYQPTSQPTPQWTQPSGWKLNPDGKWVKDENAEFDSDEDEPPKFKG
ncbi:hypothetical protein HPB47_015765 [Ixodes persulcatus]|uniref:Uncharacterized protein n=1 Tax=Ixodes persulcatus TaxID=34615 RepID=A0AC60QSK6_IXOPE|nr:hypothetical protein HPB47_015765 [Ixodes persulcatus]